MVVSNKTNKERIDKTDVRPVRARNKNKSLCQSSQHRQNVWLFQRQNILLYHYGIHGGRIFVQSNQDVQKIEIVINKPKTLLSM